MTDKITLRPCVQSIAEAMETRMRSFDGLKRLGTSDTPTSLLSRAADRAYLAKATPQRQHDYAIDAAALLAIAVWTMDHEDPNVGVNDPWRAQIAAASEALDGFARQLKEGRTCGAHIALMEPDVAGQEEGDSPARRAAITAHSYADEAVGLVTGPRQEDYSHPLEDFARTAGFWSLILGTQVTPQQVALCMVTLKLSREIHKHKRDNLVDAVGYLLTDAIVIEEDGHE